MDDNKNNIADSINPKKEKSGIDILCIFFEYVFTFFGLVFTIAGFIGSGGAKTGFIILLSAILISPLGNKLLDKLLKNVQSNSMPLRFLIQLIISFILLVCGVLSAHSNDSETTDSMIENNSGISVVMESQEKTEVATKTEPDTTQEVTEPAAETEPETIPETTEPPTEQPTEPETALDVQMDYSCKADGNNTVITVYTNLPDEAVLMLTLSGDSFSHGAAQDKVTIKNGVGVSNGFSNQGEPLNGHFTLDVSMSLAALQSNAVRAVIGEKGELLSGQYIEESSSGGKYISATFEFDLPAKYSESVSEFETEAIEETTNPEPETTEAPTEPPTQKKQVGKNINDLQYFTYNGAVRNDVTGKWYCAVCADNVNFAEYTVSYYDRYMHSGEIHAICNPLNGTTTKIVDAIDPAKIALTVYSYIDGEEWDAKLMFGGNVLAYYMVNRETGEITEK